MASRDSARPLAAASSPDMGRSFLGLAGFGALAPLAGLAPLGAALAALAFFPEGGRGEPAGPPAAATAAVVGAAGMGPDSFPGRVSWGASAASSRAWMSAMAALRAFSVWAGDMRAAFFTGTSNLVVRTARATRRGQGPREPFPARRPRGGFRPALRTCGHG